MFMYIYIQASIEYSLFCPFVNFMQTYDSDVAFIEAPLELAVLERIRSTKHRTLRRRNAIQRGHTLSKKKAIPPFPSRASRRSQLRRTSTVLGTMSGVSTNILVKQVSRMSDPSDIDYKNVRGHMHP